MSTSTTTRLALALALITGVTTTLSSGAHATSATRTAFVSGSVTGLNGGRVYVLSQWANAWTGRIQNGHFSVRVPFVQAKDATVQVVSPTGRYLGPVILHRSFETSNLACRKSTRAACLDDVVGLSGATTKIVLGTLRRMDAKMGQPTWFYAPAAKAYDARDAVRAAALDGRPWGAGTLGFIKGGIPVTHVKAATMMAHVTTSRASTNAPWLPLPSAFSPHGASTPTGASPGTGTVSLACPTLSDPAISALGGPASSAGTAPGQQLDCSGVPNILNVDVNGNTISNIADPAAASLGASSLDTLAKIVWSANSVPSYYSPTSLDANTLLAITSPTNGLNGVFSPYSFNISLGTNSAGLFPGTAKNATLSSVIADCMGIAWCLSADELTLNAGPALGSWSLASPPYSLLVNPATGQYQADIYPTPGTPIASQVQVGQVFTITGVDGSGNSSSQLESISPYFLTTPYLVGVTFSSFANLATDSSGVPIAQSNNVITLKFQRPERVANSADTSTSGLMDMAGLYYNLGISGGYNCPGDTVSNIVGGSLVVAPWLANMMVIQDSTHTDFDPSAPANPGAISFTVNVQQCAAEQGLPLTSGTNVNFYLQAFSARGNNAGTGFGYPIP